MTDRYTSEQFEQIWRAQSTPEYGAEGPDYEQSVIVAALRIASRVASDYVLMRAWYAASAQSSEPNAIAALRTALTEDSGT